VREREVAAAVDGVGGREEMLCVVMVSCRAAHC
jgi:hypothetical protein